LCNQLVASLDINHSDGDGMETGVDYLRVFKDRDRTRSYEMDRYIVLFAFSFLKHIRLGLGTASYSCDLTLILLFIAMQFVLDVAICEMYLIIM